MTLSNDIIKNTFLNLIDSNLNFDVEKNLDTEELLPQELHLKVSNENIEIKRAHNFQDNLRIQSFLTFLNESIKLVNADLNFEIIVNLSEGIEQELNVKRFCYSQRKGFKNIMIPDAHNFLTYQKVISLNSIDIPFEQKTNKAIFVGSDTGRITNRFSQRSLFCERFADDDEVIAKLIEPIRSEVRNSITKFDKVFSSNYISIQEQLKSQLIVNIDGNSTSWERPLWAMASNSICIYLEPIHEHEFESWYYPLMQFLCVIPKISIDNFKIFIRNNFEDSYWQVLNHNQKIFSLTVADLRNQYLYMAYLISHYNKKYNE
jgi:hypothetical protein